MFQPFRGAVEQFGLAPAQHSGPCRIDRSPDAVAIADQQQILRHVPDPVALPGLFLDALGQRRIEFGELVGKLAKALLALPECQARHHLLGDIAVGADQACGRSLLVALDGGFDRNPPRLAVARPDDPVLHAVLAQVAGDGIAEFLFGGFAVLGMDALHPLVMGLVGGIRRQPVNQQIFRRPAIAETGAKVDLEPADPSQLLHPRQFGLALPQRLGGDDIPGYVLTNHQHAADAVIFVDRAVAVGPVDLLEFAVTRHRHQLFFMPGGAAAAHHLFDLRTDDGPDLGPAFPAALAERARVALGPHGLAIGVVIELDEFGAPPDEHRVVGVEHDPHRGAQALRPGPGLTERTRRPVMGARQRSHFPAAGEKIRRTRFTDLQHSTRSVAGSAQASSRNLTAGRTPANAQDSGWFQISSRSMEQNGPRLRGARRRPGAAAACRMAAAISSGRRP